MIQEFRNAIGYVRVSTEQQAGADRFGVDAQKQEILLYANEKGYNIVEWVVDEASGASDERPGLNKILDDGYVTNPPYEAVIVFKNDRLARETNYIFIICMFLKRKTLNY